ncbi:MAG: GNAT family N-acetyltransferase [bacterium]|nr:GNAT family N-acetyltransferase [bacterium]
MTTLAPTTEEQLPELMTWFPDAVSCAVWGGPEHRFPFTEATFREDIHWGELPSYSLIDDGGALLGFGQYYARVGLCHLARLAITPNRRGAGLGARLVQGLCRVGCDDLSVDVCSLFVMADNTPAVRLYEKLGFVTMPYPGDFSLPGTVYMVAPGEIVAEAP